MSLLFIGIIEMIILTAWTKFVANTQVWASGIVTMINVLIWYYVLQRVIDDINNFSLILLYAFGCAIGTVISTYYFNYQENVKL